MIIRNALRSPNGRATASGLVASPQTIRCWLRRPASQRSPRRETGLSGSGGAISACSSLSGSVRGVLKFSAIEPCERKIELSQSEFLQFAGE